MDYSAKLPKNFIDRMKSLKGFNFDEFQESYKKDPLRGLRVNTLKCKVEEFQNYVDFELKKVPFCNEGFYIDNTLTGKSPLHHAGIFYFQEPSAMSAVTALDVKEGMKVLDLCAAPGGKSTQIAAKLCGTGFLLSNEIISSRASILLSNMERCGVRNFAVTNQKVENICSKFEGYFDRVLVDAPCSGEGMFKREPAALTEWSLEATEACAVRQLDILNKASCAVRPNGILVYSTCTFAPCENESVINKFLISHPEFSVDNITHTFGTAARPDWVNGDSSISLARRIFPSDGGEGHFVARLIKNDGYVSEVKPFITHEPDKLSLTLFKDFFKSQFSEEIYGSLYQKQDRLFIIPNEAPDLSGLNLLRCGVFAGRIKGNRFEPEHSLYLAANRKKTISEANFELNSKEVLDFLHGEQVAAPEHCNKGYLSFKAGGFILGFGKMSNGVIKNHYPKGLRNL